MVIVGDFEMDHAQKLAERYIGSVETAEADERIGGLADEKEPESVPFNTQPAETFRLHVEDSDRRAVAYIIGKAPNRAGYLHDGRSLVDAVVDHIRKGSGSDVNVPQRWRHPVFPTVALTLLQEVINRRLFSVVREKKQLTYDANFQLAEIDRLRGGWYLVSVTASSRTNADLALEACQDTLRGLTRTQPPTRDPVLDFLHFFFHFLVFGFSDFLVFGFSTI